MRILVTGGAGFIGSHLAERYLRDGCEVLVVDDLSTGKMENIPNGCAFERECVATGDLAGLLANFRPTVISHHAAQISVARSMRDAVDDVQRNVVGTVNVLAAAVGAGVEHVVFASSGGTIYGEVTEQPHTEDVSAKPASVYGTSKLAAELFLQMYSEVHGLRTTALRYANVYGPRQDPHGEAGVVAIFARAILNGERPTIFGAGDQTRDYVFVDDVVEANVQVVLTRKTGVFNVGTGEEVSVRSMFDEVRGALGVAVEPRHGEVRPGDLQRSCLDSRLALAELDWSPKTSLREGIAKTVASFRATSNKQQRFG